MSQEYLKIKAEKVVQASVECLVVQDNDCYNEAHRLLGQGEFLLGVSHASHRSACMLMQGRAGLRTNRHKLIKSTSVMTWA